MKQHGPHDPQGKTKILARLRSAQGHLASVLEMVENDAYCIDVLRQTSAVRAAIAKVEDLLLERHMHHCVSTAIRGESAADRERVVGELVELFETRKR